MPRFIMFYILIILLLIVSLSLAGIPHLINYQGMLTQSDGKTPVTNGNYSILFSIYNTSSGGSSLWSHTYNVAVTNGLFNVILGDSSAPINLPFDTTYWLGIKVGADLELSPRIRLTSVGYAYRAEKTDTASYAKNGPWGGNNAWIFRITDTADTTLTTGGAWGIARYGNVLHGNADYTHVNLGVACTTGTSGQNYKYCTVGGGYKNSASDWYATVGGGENNTASYWATVGGGWNNTASGGAATVGGGEENTASGLATVGGGGYNTASSNSATVGGGWMNTASGDWATVGGGFYNSASDENATVGGGLYNSASGDYSFAAGRRAKANHIGAFVWADGTDADFASTGENQFLIRAAGGVGIGTTSPNAALSVDGVISIQQSDTSKYHLDYYNGGLNFAETGVSDYRLFIKDGGNVGIGTSNPNYKLDVNGNINVAGSYNVKKGGVNYTHPDYVFEPDYDLMPLEELKKYVSEKKCLPDVISAEDVKKNEGFKMDELLIQMLEKIEEQTLYIIQLEERIANLEKKQ